VQVHSHPTVPIIPTLTTRTRSLQCEAASPLWFPSSVPPGSAVQGWLGTVELFRMDEVSSSDAVNWFVLRNNKMALPDYYAEMQSQHLRCLLGSMRLE